MQFEKDKDTQQLFRHICEANKQLDEFFQSYGDKILQLIDNQHEEGILDIQKLTFQQETCAQTPFQKPVFFSQLPLITIDEQTQDKIMNLKLNFMSARRKDEIFKRHRKEQEEILMQKKKQAESMYIIRNENLRHIKGQFTLKIGELTHTCSITGEDIQKLRPEADLNDTIIANYLKYLQAEVFNQQKEKAMFIYSTFFIQKLVGELLRDDINFMDRDIKLLGQKMKLKVTQNYKNIQRWTRKVDIFEKEYLVIPINAFKHWYCVIVLNPGAILSSTSAKRPCIVNCDSMFQIRPFIIQAVRMYLQVELEGKKGVKLEITEHNLPCYHLILPRQTNTHDCGLYMLTYIEHLISNSSELQNLHEVKNRSKLHMFPRTLIFLMRQRLKDLFLNLIMTADEAARKQVLRKYKEESDKIIKEAKQSDYDCINEKDFKKYETLNSCMLQMSGYNVAEMSQEQKQHAMKVKYYIDPEINFYERDKGFIV